MPPGKRQVVGVIPQIRLLKLLHLPELGGPGATVLPLPKMRSACRCCVKTVMLFLESGDMCHFGNHLHSTFKFKGALGCKMCTDPSAYPLKGPNWRDKCTEQRSQLRTFGIAQENTHIHISCANVAGMDIRHSLSGARNLREPHRLVFKGAPLHWQRAFRFLFQGCSCWFPLPEQRENNNNNDNKTFHK